MSWIATPFWPISAVTRPLALQAAHLKARHRMPSADCFAAALAVELQASVITGDPEFHSVEQQILVVWLVPQ